MNILITESQFKRLIENIIKEQEDNYDVFDDPKAISLVNYLNKTEREDYALMNVKLIDDDFYAKYKGMDMPVYEINKKRYAVGTYDEFIKYLKKLGIRDIDWRAVQNSRYDNYYIYKIGI